MSVTFDMSVTCREIRRAARDGSVTSYDKLEEVHKVRTQPGYDRKALFRHLGDVLCVSYQLGLPALTAVVVTDIPKELDGTALGGFARSAERAGYKFKNNEKFAREQKEATFEWARNADTKLGDAK